MNYEEWYRSAGSAQKGLRDSVGTVNRLLKAVMTDMENGNLTDMKKCLAQMTEAAEALGQKVTDLTETVESFYTREYFASGDFAKQLLAECKAKKIDVIGEKGMYEMFPFKVRIYGDEERAEEVWVNRKKVPSVRPSFVADYVKESRDRLYKVSFNETAFMTELADAYETTCLKNGTRIGGSVGLGSIYKIMTPMARARKEYDMQAFAFDLARLYEKGPQAWVTKDGKYYTFGTSRDGKKGIRVLNSNGTEDFITTFRPLMTEE